MQALSVGVPVVTLPSQLLAGRLTLAMYEKMDIMDLIARSPNDFVNIALQVRACNGLEHGWLGSPAPHWCS